MSNNNNNNKPNITTKLEKKIAHIVGNIGSLTLYSAIKQKSINKNLLLDLLMTESLARFVLDEMLNKLNMFNKPLFNKIISSIVGYTTNYMLFHKGTIPSLGNILIYVLINLNTMYNLMPYIINIENTLEDDFFNDNNNTKNNKKKNMM